MLARGGDPSEPPAGSPVLTLQYLIGFLKSGQFLDLKDLCHDDGADVLADLLDPFDLEADGGEPPRDLADVDGFGQRRVLQQPGKRD